VRMGPVPAPLAAHIGEDGLVVLNVVEGSPADAAGLKQYDVIRTFNDSEIIELQNLVDAISENGADQTASLVVVSGGQERTISITPIKRDDSGAAPTWKYAEENAITLDNSTNLKSMFGYTDPSGNMVWQHFVPGTQWNPADPNAPQVLTFDPKQFNIELDLDTDNGGTWSLPAMILNPGQSTQHDHTIEIQVSDDNGEPTTTIKVRRDDTNISVTQVGEGEITVKRSTEGGEETVNTYADRDALEQDDPEAAELLKGHGDVHVFCNIQPQIEALPGHFKTFRREIRQRVDEARSQIEQSRAALEQAMREFEKQTLETEEAGAAAEDYEARIHELMREVERMRKQLAERSKSDGQKD
jgi:hypothetical protein